MKIAIVSFYKFVELENLIELKEKLNKILNPSYEVKGTILLAKEGINLNLAIQKENLKELWKQVYSTINKHSKNPAIAEEYKVLLAKEMPFQNLKIKIKSEIITFKQDRIDQVGSYILPKNWGKILKIPEIKLIDVRNNYEIKIGTFYGAINPNVKSFSDLAEYFQEQNWDQNQPIAMFCTGGIRCEKASCFLINKGYKQVYQLKGGILNYFQETQDTDKLWYGKCFVFDKRYSIAVCDTCL